MSDGSPFPPNDVPTETPKPRGGIANLMPPPKPGEVRNPYGRNGRNKNKVIVDFLEEIDPRDKKERTRIRAFLETLYLRALAGHGVAIKYLGEQYAGRPIAQVDHTSSDGSMSPGNDDPLRNRLRAEISAAVSQLDLEAKSDDGGDEK